MLSSTHNITFAANPNLVTPQPQLIASAVSPNIFEIIDTPTGISGNIGTLVPAGLPRGEQSLYDDWPKANVGGAELPAHYFTVLVTSPGAIHLTIDTVESQPYLADLLAYVRPLAPGILMPGQVLRKAQPEPINLPTSPVFIQGEALAGTQRVATLAISPVFTRDGQVRVATSVVFRVEGVSYLFGDSSNHSAVEQNRISQFASFSSASSVTGVLARGSADTNTLACENTVPNPVQPFAASVGNQALRNSIWRVTVTEPGIQRLTAATLPPAVATDYQVWRGGVQLPIDVVNGEVHFYAPAAGDRFNPSYTYWLVTNNGPGRRMLVGSAVAGGGRTTAYEMGMWRESKQYISSFTGPAGDRWFAASLDSVATAPPRRDYAFTIANKLGAAGDTLVSVDSWRRNANVHSLTVSIGGTAGAPVTGAGYGNWTTSNVSINSTAAGANIHLDNPTAGAVESLDIQQIHWTRLVNLSFSAAAPSVRLLTLAGPQQYSLAGLPSGASVYDVTDPTNPIIVTLSGVSFQSAGNREYYVMIPATAPQPNVKYYSNWEDLSSSGRVGNAVYIAHSNFVGSLGRLLTLRSDQGYKPQVYSVDRIYDWFGTGDIDAESIRSFLRYANATWTVKPLAVTLVGDTSYDPRNYMVDFNWLKGPEDYINNIYVPTYLLDVDSSIGEADCDTCFVRWSCNSVYIAGAATSTYDTLPDAYIGRLSVINTAQLDVLVSKIVSYETSSDNGTWRAQQRYFADNTDPGADSFSAANEILISRQPTGTSIGRLNFSIVNPSNQDNEAKAFEIKVTPLLNLGEGLTVYSGHGNWPLWASPMLYYVDDAANINNSGHMPLMLAFTCATSTIDHPMPDGASIDEKFHRGANSAIAVWGSSGWDTVHVHDLLAQGLFDKLWAPTTASRSQPIGALVNAGLANLAASYNQGNSLYTFILLGDPLTKLRVNPQHAFPGEIDMGTIAGQLDGTPGSKDAIGTNASFSAPTRVAVSPDGLYGYVSDTSNHTIRRVNITNGLVTTIAGVAGVPGAQNGGLGTGHLSSPAGIAVSPNGLFAYIADTGNNAIRQIDLKDFTVSTLVSGLSGPTGIAASWDGVALYFSEPSAHSVRRLLLGSNEIQPVTAGGLLSGPDGIAISGDGTFALVSDAVGNSVLKIDLTVYPFQVSTIIAPGAGLNQPHGVALGTDGRYAYVADTGNNVIRRIALTSNVMTTVSGVVGISGRHDGKGAIARYNLPVGIAMNLSENKLLVGDSNNNELRYATVIPSTQVVYLPLLKR